MARELIGLRGGCRVVWRGFKQALAESLPVAPRPLHLSGNVRQQKIGEVTVMARDSSSSGRGGWREFVAERSTGSRGFSRGERVQTHSEGLSSLLSPSRRPDAAMLQRAAAVVVRTCTLELSGPQGRAASKASTAFPGGVLLHKMQYSSCRAVASRSSSTSAFVKGQMEQSRQVALLTSSAAAGARRNLSSSSETTTWVERWNKLKNVIRPKQQVQSKAGGEGGAASVGPKKFVGEGRGRTILSDAASPIRKTFSHYREAVGLQIEAFWKRNYLVVVGLVGLGVCLLLWRLMFGIASTFISMSEGLAKFGFLALAAAMVIVGGVVLRARLTINPDAVYRIAMRRLNTSAGVLEVLGAPLSGSDLRAYIMSGGGVRMKNFRPRLAGKRCFIIFPIQGADRRGLVSIEVKKKKGQYNFKLLAVDVPTAGADQRLYLIGDEEEYRVGGGLMNELRDPIVKAMAAQKEFEELDLREDEDEERKAMEAEQLRVQEERDRLAREQEAREEDDRLAREQEAREQDELKQLKDEPIALDDLETPAEHQGKDAKPVRAQVGYVGP